MKKGDAIQFFNSAIGHQRLSNANCNFAKINAAVPLWWLDIRPERFKKDLYIILDEGEYLILLRIPEGRFDPPQDYFYIRGDNGKVQLTISSVEGNSYLLERKGDKKINFQPFIIERKKVPADLRDVKIKSEGNKRKRQNSNVISNPTSLQYIIKQDDTGISYENLFGKYLKGAKIITIQDPYIRNPHQYKNLLEFCSMIGRLKDKEESISLEIVTWNEKASRSQSEEYLKEVAISAQQLKINLTYKFENHHDRYIAGDTGWKIIPGRGLDIFQRSNGRLSIADVDQTLRKCKPCEITYVRIH